MLVVPNANVEFLSEACTRSTGTDSEQTFSHSIATRRNREVHGGNFVHAKIDYARHYGWSNMGKEREAGQCNICFFATILYLPENPWKETSMTSIRPQHTMRRSVDDSFRALEMGLNTFVRPGKVARQEHIERLQELIHCARLGAVRSAVAPLGYLPDFHHERAAKLIEQGSPDEIRTVVCDFLSDELALAFREGVDVKGMSAWIGDQLTGEKSLEQISDEAIVRFIPHVSDRGPWARIVEGVVRQSIGLEANIHSPFYNQDIAAAVASGLRKRLAAPSVQAANDADHAPEDIGGPDSVLQDAVRNVARDAVGRIEALIGAELDPQAAAAIARAIKDAAGIAEPDLDRQAGAPKNSHHSPDTTEEVSDAFLVWT